MQYPSRPAIIAQSRLFNCQKPTCGAPRQHMTTDKLTIPLQCKIVSIRIVLVKKFDVSEGSERSFSISITDWRFWADVWDLNAATKGDS